MKRTISVLTILSLAASLAVAQSAAPAKVIHEAKRDVSPPLYQILEKSATPLWLLEKQNREIPNVLPSTSSKFSLKEPGASPGIDALASSSVPSTTTNNLTVNLNLDGTGNVSGVAPPDPNMDVGPNHIVQTINLVTTIFDKSGNIVPGGGPFLTSDLWNGFGGACENNNDGDPVVLWDQLANKWVISQFVFSSMQCVAVSTTSDPTGSYNRYAFSTPGNDYPKMGVMEDAYYMTIRNFSGGFNMDAAAMDRQAMCNGDPATIVIFNLSSVNPDCEGVLPADWEGFTPPPAGTPGLFLGHNCGPSLVHNQIDVFEMTGGFPPTSLATANQVNVTTFDLNQPNIPQPSPGGSLDDLAFFTMHRAGLRDFGAGNHFSMVLTHTANSGGGVAGVRWYELRDASRSGSGWTLFQEGTQALGDGLHRWMPSIAINGNGDIGLSYTTSSSSSFPSIRATGRLASDPPGVMTCPEQVIVAGGGSQTNTSRWGDYASLSVDPSNDLTFFGTHEYVKNTGSFNWQTRVFSFDLDPGVPTPPAITSTPNTSASVGVPYVYDADNIVDVTGTPPITFSFTGPPGFDVDANTGLVSWTPTSSDLGPNPVSITATNAQGSDTQNFTINVSLPPAFAARINAGGSNYTATNGDLFVADQPYTSGSFGFVGGVTNTLSAPIGGTTDDPLYQSLRRSGNAASSFAYRFDVPSAATYDVTLHLMAPAIGSGDFILDVVAEGATVFSGLNVNNEAGGTYQALIKTFSASVSDGTLDIDFVRVNKQAVVGAIEVVEGTPPPPTPDIDVSPLALNFGQVTAGQTADLPVTITNTGGAVLTVNQLNVTNSVFSLVTPPSLPFTVAANGGSQSLTVRFSPSVAGNESGNLEIVSDDPDEPSVNVALDGEGISLPSGDEFRINAGGPNFTDSNGNLFVADQAYVSGGFGFAGGLTASVSNPIGGTTDDPLYQDLRRSSESGSFSYRFDVSSAGTFDVNLHLMALPIGPGSFVLDVLAEGAIVFNDLDINSEAGGTLQALIKSFSVSVTDGTLDLDFVRVNKPALVCGIEVIEQTNSPEVAKGGHSQEPLTSHTPSDFRLFQNHPNPFNPSTAIRYHVPRGMEVTLKVYNMLGEEVATLVNGYHEAGSYEVMWNALRDSGVRAPSGVYLYRLQGPGLVEVKKMILLQ